MTIALLNNRYQILQKLGRGGFGQTFLVIDTHMPSGRKCVLKQIQSINQDPKSQQWLQERFQREAAILELLGEGHGQIPQLYAYFSEADIFYLIQEWIEGVTLKQKQEQQGTLSPQEVKEILLSLLPVLDYVHSHRIVHRDIKPENVIVRQKDGKPVLIDFGAVKEAMATIVNPNASNSFSVAIGTPGYMPSEQAAGRPLYSSDLYSLGLTAVYLLTGKNPQQLLTDSQTGEIIWRKGVGNLHSDLAIVIEKAIRFHPRDRFSTAKEMLTALQSFAQNSRAATLALAPQGLSSKENQSTKAQTTATVAVTPSTSNKNNRNRGIRFWFALLTLGGLVIATLILGFDFFFQPENSRPISSTSQPEKELPISTSPLPTPEITPTPETTPIPEIEPKTEPEPIPEEPPEVIPSPSPITVSPVPSPEPEVIEGNQVNVPIFTPGTNKSQLIAKLGQPTSDTKGYWQNSRALLYKNFVPNQVDLGYLLDTNSEKIRQTEVSFAQSVDLKVMQATLADLLEGNVPSFIQEDLEQIYQRQKDLRFFSVGNLKGMIRRNKSDRIYIGIWEADFH